MKHDASNHKNRQRTSTLLLSIAALVAASACGTDPGEPLDLEVLNQNLTPPPDDDPMNTRILFVFTKEAMDWLTAPQHKVRLHKITDPDDGMEERTITNARDWVNAALADLNEGYHGSTGANRANLPVSFEAAGDPVVLTEPVEPVGADSNTVCDVLRYEFYRNRLGDTLLDREARDADFAVLVGANPTNSGGINAYAALGGYGMAMVMARSIDALRHEVGHVYGAQHCSGAMHYCDRADIAKALFNVANFRRRNDELGMARPLTVDLTGGEVARGGYEYYKFMHDGIRTPAVIETIGPSNTWATLYDNDGRVVDVDYHDGANDNFKIDTVLTRGTYYLRVGRESAGQSGRYHLEVDGAFHHSALAPAHIPATNRCVEVQGGTTRDGTKLIQWACSGSRNQKFYHRADGRLEVFGQDYEITQSCLDDLGADQTLTLPASVLQALEGLVGNYYSSNERLLDGLESVLSNEESRLYRRAVYAHCSYKPIFKITYGLDDNGKATGCVADMDADPAYPISATDVTKLATLKGVYHSAEDLRAALATLFSNPNAYLDAAKLYCKHSPARCVSVPATANGTPAVLAKCGSGEDKRFQMRADGTIRVRAGTANEKCLEVEGASTGTGTTADRVLIQAGTCDPVNKKHQIFNHM